jgi:CxxC-x17-CxxC domain-containing protein
MYLGIKTYCTRKFYATLLTAQAVYKKEEKTKMAYGDNKGGYGDREMHKVTCSDCGKETEVPFKPSGDRPVYCKDCYQKHRPPRRY